MNKTIWILNQYVTHPSMPGGTRHLDIASELISNGYDVHIFASGFHYLKLKETVLNKNEKFKLEHYKNIVIHWLRVKPYKNNNYQRLFSMISFYFSLKKEIKRYLKDSSFIQPDIIIGSSVHLFTVLAAYKFAKIFKSKFIVEIRDLWPFTLTATGEMSRFNPVVLMFSFLERFLYKKASKIVVLPEKAGDYISRYTDSDKIAWIPNSFNEDLLKTDNVKLSLHSTDKFRIMFAGSINLFDNLMLLIKAIEKVHEKVKNIELVILGDGMDKQNIVNYVNNNKLSEYIKFHDPVPKKHIIRYLSLANALWVGMPDSKLYKYGISFNKLYDYMASKKPIILSAPKIENIVKNGNCGLIAKAENLDDLANKIYELYNMTDNERLILGQNGFNYLCNNFTTKIVAQKFIKEVIE